MNTLFTAITLLAAAMPAAAPTEDMNPIAVHKISVTGTAVTQVVPDVIAWSIYTLDESKNLLEAKESSDRKLNAAMSLVNELGVKPEDVQTGYVSIGREYNHDEKGQQLDFKCFSVRRGINVKQRDLKRFDEFLSKLIARAEFDVSFGLETTRMTELRWDTRLKAMKIAKDKADALAQIAGAKVGKAIVIEEPGPRDGLQPYFANNANSIYQPEAARSQQPDTVQGTFAPGSVEVKVTVRAEFELE